jgi:hypothetical protein
VVNTYAVIVGQAQVVKSVTTSYAATVANGVFTKITDTGAHGYSRSVTTVDYSFNGLGQLVGATGRRWGTRTARCGQTRTGDGTVDAGEMVDQPTTFSVVNTYAVIVGQAQVVKSVTTSYAATVSKGVFTKITDTGAHGYSRSVTTVNYSFNELGQLVGRGVDGGRAEQRGVDGHEPDGWWMPGRWWTSRRRSVWKTPRVIVGSGAGGEERDDELCGDGVERRVHEDHGHGCARV